ncbi:PstS family phosphate ABC transporter substrate-binding protein [Isoptericola halotolerans]|uniref:PstS family phosphate ABC transporter substrate-binding protein n=1 Tax=Isoptericola halotolerans TaxID=300560 RepID=UPI003891031F
MLKNHKRAAALIGATGLALSLAACGGSDTPGDEAANGAGGGENGEAMAGSVVIDGSSTVAPNTEVAAELFGEEQPDVRVSVGVSGTGGGFEKFCNGETDISEASRPIKEDEAQRCEENGISYAELGIANDGLAVAVNPANDWAQCLTIEEVSSMWRPDGPVDSWADVRDGFPDEPITLYGPGSDSGTFDFFTEEVNGESGAIRADYNDIGEDDFGAVQGVEGATGATAFIPLSFVEEAGDAVRAVEIENEDGECIAPSLDTVMDGTYNPLGRQLYVYPSDTGLEKPEVQAFLEFYILNQAQIAEEAGFIPLNEDQEQVAGDALAELVG